MKNNNHFFGMEKDFNSFLADWAFCMKFGPHNWKIESVVNGCVKSVAENEYYIAIEWAHSKEGYVAYKYFDKVDGFSTTWKCDWVDWRTPEPW